METITSSSGDMTQDLTELEPVISAPSTVMNEPFTVKVEEASLSSDLDNMIEIKQEVEMDLSLTVSEPLKRESVCIKEEEGSTLPGSAPCEEGISHQPPTSNVEDNTTGGKVCDQGLYNCLHCEYQAVRPDHLRNHVMARHSDAPPPLACPHCEYRAVRSGPMKKHIMAKHSDSPPPFACTNCEYRTVRSDHLKRHIQGKHSQGPPPLACPHCEYRSTRSCTLKIHIMARHSDGPPPLACPHCDYRTVRPAHLRRHILAKHTDV